MSFSLLCAPCFLRIFQEVMIYALCRPVAISIFLVIVASPRQAQFEDVHDAVIRHEFASYFPYLPVPVSPPAPSFFASMRKYTMDDLVRQDPAEMVFAYGLH